MWENGVFNIRFIKDLIIISVLLAGFIALCIKIPEHAKKDIEK